MNTSDKNNEAGTETAKYIRTMQRQMAEANTRIEAMKLEVAQLRDENKRLAKQVKAYEAKASGGRFGEGDVRRAIHAANERVAAMASVMESQAQTLRDLSKELKASRIKNGYAMEVGTLPNGAYTIVSSPIPRGAQGDDDAAESVQEAVSEAVPSQPIAS